MSQRSKSLLEAFNQSKAPEKSAEPVAPPRGSAPRVGGPFADPAAPRSEPRAAAARPLGEAARAPLGASRARLIALGALIAATFFVLGRASAPEVKAADEGASGDQVAGPNLPASQPAAPTTPANYKEAVLDAENRYCIVAVSYTHNEANKQLAVETAAWLNGLGLPAGAYEYPAKKQITVLVGAAHGISDLDGLLARVQQAKTAKGRLDFASAYTAPIDNYVKR